MDFEAFNEYYRKNPPEVVMDDTGIRHQKEIALPAKYEREPCPCGIVHEISYGTWYHSHLKMLQNDPDSIKIVKKCKTCHEILLMKLAIK